MKQQPPNNNNTSQPDMEENEQVQGKLEVLSVFLVKFI